MRSKKLTTLSIFSAILIGIAALYVVEFVKFRQAMRKETNARNLIEIGDEIEVAHRTLKENGFAVSDVKVQKGIGIRVIKVELSELGKMDSFRYGTGVDLTPFSYEPKHWLVIKTQAGSSKVATLVSK